MVTALRTLQTPNARKRLSAREEPYYQEIERGLAIGYRKGEGAGSWLLREYKAGRYVKRRLGAADDVLPADGAVVLSWGQALNLARAADRPTVSQPGVWTVAEAAEDYFSTRASDSKVDRTTYQAFVEEPLGKRPIAELTTGELERWKADQVRKRLAELAELGGEGFDEREARRRAQVTCNRRWSVLRAILNSAYRKEPHSVPSDNAWRRVRPFLKVDRPRTHTLSAKDAQALLAALPADLAGLARASLYAGLRLGEAMRLQAGDVASGQVAVRHSKSGRPRVVPLDPEGVAFFGSVAKGKAATDVLFPPAGAGEWYRVGIARAMKDASARAGVPTTRFHDLRRSYGSLLLNSGASADQIQELLGHADIRMTRRAYAHMAEQTLRTAVAKHLPSFGFETPKREPKKRKRAK